ncbi:O-acetyltransferase [Legionella pneumophila]|nr:O-acetyltransferase [Legionella pneumophila]
MAPKTNGYHSNGFNMASNDNKLTLSQTTYINFLRGVSAIIVLAGHVFSSVPGNFSFGKELPFQSLAVSVFFWLSGFLIAYHCLTKKSYSFTEFIIDRFCRIYVIYIPVLALSVLLLVKAHVVPLPPFKQFLGNILMLQHTPFDRLSASLPAIPVLAEISPLWTIAIEWWLYTLFGIVFFFHKSSFSTRLFMSILFVPAVIVTGIFSLKEYVAWTWFLGVGCAFHFCNLNSVYDNRALKLLSIISIIAFLVRLFILKNSAMNMYDMQLIFPGCIFLYSLLLMLSTIRINKHLEILSTSLAFISYTLYLVHEPLRRVLSKFILPSNLMRGFLICAMIIGCSAIIANLLENKHFIVRQWLKNKLMLKKSAIRPAFSI